MIVGMLSDVYGKIVKMRNKRYDDEKNLIVKLQKPVISVGNISVGGTGKTPFVQMLVRELNKLGLRSAIVGRGYKRKTKGELIVCDGKQIFSNASDAGDEMILLAKSLKVPVVAHDSKAKGALSAERRFDIDCIVVDDGFQHRALNRTLDIVILDNESIQNPYLMPKGRLREPLDSLLRANVIVLTGSLEIKDIPSEYYRKTTLFIKVKPYQARPYFLENEKLVSDIQLEKAMKAIVPIAAIAKPQRFFDMLKVSGFKCLSPISFNDHHSFNRNDIEKIRRAAFENKTKYIATTEKDAVKLIEFTKRFSHFGLKVLVFPINIKITYGKQEFLNLLKFTIA